MKYGLLGLSHGPGFKGLHNRVKTKCFIVLYKYDSNYLTTRELATRAGVKHHSVESLIANWHKWGYVHRQVSNGVYTYSLAKHGRDFLIKWRKQIPFDEYSKELTLS